MYLTQNTAFVIDETRRTAPVDRALAALRRDLARVPAPTDAPGGTLCLQYAAGLPAEGWRLCQADETLTLTAGDALGFVYGIYAVSKEILGVQPFWFWCDQTFTPAKSLEIPAGWQRASRPARVRWRGWFINDETLLSHWCVQRRPEGAWEMAFEALLRLGGNLVIPGTDQNAHRYRALAASYGLTVTHHHAEPLGAEMFARAYPDLTPSFAQYPALFRGLWRDALQAQRGTPTLWNIGFRGQGDRPFWADDPAYSTPQARGKLMSDLMAEQYALVQQECPGALCCTNLYGETMVLYQQGCLKLPENVIPIWADNGYGKMVSRRQGNENPRIPALPAAADGGAHGIYYHASFYDLQAASHITLLPNSAEFVRAELCEALAHGADALWLINCSNIKPHTYLLDLMAALWQDGAAAPTAEAHRQAYAAAYYGPEHAALVAGCLAGYAKAAVAYGPHADDHAGEQFYHHVVRMLLSQFLKNGGTDAPAEDLRWLCDAEALSAQLAGIAPLYQSACAGYEDALRRCEAAHAALAGTPRTLFADTLLLQAKLYAHSSRGAVAACAALAAAHQKDYQAAFYCAGCAKNQYTLANEALRAAEHGRWIDFYKNECQTDVKQTAAVCAMLMGYLRNLGEGPHFYAWQREFEDAEADRRVLLILNTENHPTDDALWRLMDQSERFPAPVAFWAGAVYTFGNVRYK